MSATSTAFTNGSQYLPTNATIVSGITSTPQVGACLAPANTLGYPITLPAANGSAPAAVKVFSTPANTGLGAATLASSFQLSVPQNAYAGNYSSTWTITISSGP